MKPQRRASAADDKEKSGGERNINEEGGGNETGRHGFAASKRILISDTSGLISVTADELIVPNPACTNKG